MSNITLGHTLIYIIFLSEGSSSMSCSEHTVHAVWSGHVLLCINIIRRIMPSLLSPWKRPPLSKGLGLQRGVLAAGDSPRRTT